MAALTLQSDHPSAPREVGAVLNKTSDVSGGELSATAPVGL